MSARIASYLDALSRDAARTALTRCCGSRRWVEAMLRSRPFATDAALMEAAERAWWGLQPADWKEAFGAHPRIGETSGDERGRAKASTAWSGEEQRGVAKATADVRAALVEGNREYETRFGHVFLICATGRSADQMLAELRLRLNNDPAAELRIAAGEQAKITRLRLEKLVTP